MPGTTRDTLDATADVRGIPVELVDTAGLRETEDTVEKIGVPRAWEAAEASDMVLYVFDAAVGWTPEDAAALARFDGAPALVIANKIDRLSGRPLDGAPPGATPLSGIAPEAGQSSTRCSRSGSPAMSRPTRPRKSWPPCASAISSRGRGVGGRPGARRPRPGESPEYAATHLDAALDALADLFGETTAEDVLRTDLRHLLHRKVVASRQNW